MVVEETAKKVSHENMFQRARAVAAMRAHSPPAICFGRDGLGGPGLAGWSGGAMQHQLEGQRGRVASMTQDRLGGQYGNASSRAQYQLGSLLFFIVVGVCGEERTSSLQLQVARK